MNPKVRKFFAILLLTIMLIISSTNYYGIKGIDNLAYVVALGLDVGEQEELKLSLQISIPTSESSSSSSQSSSVVVDSIECSSIHSGINLFNSYLGKEVNLSHCKVLVISEELASKGVSEYLYTLTNDMKFRNSSNIIISKSDAKSYLEYSAPLLDKVSARYYEIAPSSSEYTGYTESITCNQFFSSITDTFSDPVAILGSVNSKNTQTLDSNSSASSDSSDVVANENASYTAGKTPFSGESGVENMGLAVFQGDRLVGELNGFESICHLIVSSKLKNAQIRIPSSIEELDYIDLYIELEKDTNNTVLLVNGSPYIKSNPKIIAKMQSMNGNINLKDDEIVSKIEQSAKDFLEKNISDYLYKTAKILESDVDSFGLYALKYFSTTSEWEEFNWLHRYKDAFFDVNVDVNLRSSYLLVDTVKQDA